MSLIAISKILETLYDAFVRRSELFPLFLVIGVLLAIVVTHSRRDKKDRRDQDCNSDSDKGR